jgi:hypothetical protein
VVLIGAEAFTNELVGAIAKRGMGKFRQRFREADALIVDDIEFIAGKEATQEAFFHTFNAVVDGGKQIVVTGCSSPGEINRMQGRVVSRLTSGLTVELRSPDFAARVAILERKLMGSRLVVSREVLELIAGGVRGDLRAVVGALETVRGYAELEKVAVTVDLAARVLGDVILEGQRSRVTIEEVQSAVCEEFGVRLLDLIGKGHERRFAAARHVAMSLCRRLNSSLSFGEIAAAFGGRGHTAVMYGCGAVAVLARSDSVVRAAVARIERRLEVDGGTVGVSCEGRRDEPGSQVGKRRGGSGAKSAGKKHKVEILGETDAVIHRLSGELQIPVEEVVHHAANLLAAVRTAPPKQRRTRRLLPRRKGDVESLGALAASAASKVKLEGGDTDDTEKI